MNHQLGKLSRKSETTAAIQYALNRWEALIWYAEDGRPSSTVKRTSH
ncbi:IS66 family transposase [Crenobacter oryzisoli]